MSHQQNDILELKVANTRDLEQCFFKTLFNDPKFIRLQSQESLTFLLLIDGEECGVFHCTIEDKMAWSPYRSLFGGFETCKKVGDEELTFFISETLKYLKKKKVDKIQITLPANFFRKPKNKLQRKKLLEAGFEKTLKLKNHHIEINEKSLLPQLHEMEKRKLKKSNKEGLTFQKESVELLSHVFNFIAICRKEKKQPLNITLDNLQKSFEAFPDNYFIFSVKQNNEFFAVTIAVKVNENILYNFLPASPVKFNYLSPTVKLIDGLYSFAKKNSFKFLDLGISTTKDGEDQQSLLQFKKHMGGKRSTKIQLEKKLKI